MIFKSIAFDIDGTLTDFKSSMIERFKIFYEEKYSKYYRGKIDYACEQLSQTFPDCDRDTVQEFESTFWKWYMDNITLRPYVTELFMLLKRMHITIYIITARYKESGLENIESITKDWILRNKLPVEEKNIYFSSDKLATMKDIGCELLVDDMAHNLLNVSKEFPCICMDTPYNKLCIGKNIWRIKSFEPKGFVQTLHLIKELMESYEPDFNANAYKKPEVLPKAINETSVIFNDTELGKHKILFIIPFDNPESPKSKPWVMEQAKKYSTSFIPLSLINKPLEQWKDEKSLSSVEKVIYALIKKYGKGMDLSKNDNPNTYIAKTMILSDLLDYCKSLKGKSILYGMDIILLSRDKLQLYKKYPVILTDLNERDKNIIIQNMHKKDQTWYLHIEDLLELSTQLRKWRIIAGTAKKELPTYINRQNTDSDGIDYVRLLPGETPYQPDIVSSIVSMDTFLICDPHISSKKPEKTKMIIRSINARVSRHDHLIILGDLDGKKGTGSIELTKKFVGSINTKNIYLILGNNDPYSIETYAKIGFKSVVDKVIYKDSSARVIYLTHCAVPVNRGEINIHGHIHGSKCYWNLDWHNHYDVWNEDFTPITIRECLEIIEKGLYTATSENHTRQ